MIEMVGEVDESEKTSLIRVFLNIGENNPLMISMVLVGVVGAFIS